MKRRNNPLNFFLFGSSLLLTLTALPRHAAVVGISRAEWLLFLGFVLATGFSITLGYHRLFSHRSFQASFPVKLFCLFFGAAALEESALLWASMHRDHHRYVDTDRDPYNIKRGFWYAHIGWMLFWCHDPDYKNVKDLMSDPWIMRQHRHYAVWAVGAGILLPMAIGLAIGRPGGVFLLTVAARLALVHHSTFSINSICHTFGRATYDINATARDHWLVAILTNGEGYHNFHHRFAGDYRNGVRWYQWDPTKWAIFFLSRCGQAWGLRRTSPQMILQARIAANYLLRAGGPAEDRA